MDGLDLEHMKSPYAVTRRRWLILSLFVAYSALNALQWTQYTIIQDVVMKYYGVSANTVSWTSMVYMVTYVPMIMPESFLLSKTVSNLHEMYVIILHLCEFYDYIKMGLSFFSSG